MMKKITGALKWYLNGNFIPILVLLANLILFYALAFVSDYFAPQNDILVWVVIVLFFLAHVLLIGLAISGLYKCLEHRFIFGILHILISLIVFLGIWFSVVIFMFVSNARPDEFISRNGITMPTDIEICEPYDYNHPFSGESKEASIALKNGIQGGMYYCEVLANPQEDGTIYLKAFEATKNIPLSVADLKKSSRWRIGCSDNPNELFSSYTKFTIYEGNWEEYYAARFEVWFKPANGEPERKLFEKVFKIEGWMH